MNGRAKRAVGVDIGSRRIKVVALKKSKNGIELEQYHIESLPHGCIVDRQITDSLRLSEILTDLGKKAKIRGREVCSSVYGKGVAIKKILTDSMSDTELAGAITYEAEQNFPFDIRDVCLDYIPLPRELDTEGMEVLMVAAKNDLVYSTIDLLRDSGSQLGLLEVEPFALQAALTESGDIDDTSTIAVLQIGFQTSTITLFHEGQFEGSRDINIAGRTYVEELIRQRGVTFERATAILVREKLTPADESALEDVTRKIGEQFASAIVRAFPTSFGSVAEKPVSHILLCGGGAHLPGIVSILSEKFDVTTEVANPLSFILPSTDGREDDWTAVAPDLTTAVGLALRGLGDLYPGFNLMPDVERKGGRKSRLAGASVILPILGFALMLLAMVITTIVQENKLGVLRHESMEINSEVAVYAAKIAVVEELTSKRKDIVERINLIEKLDHDRFLRLHILDEINRGLPSLTWFTSIREEGEGAGIMFTIQGVTSSNLKVAELMSKLVESPFLSTVDLTVTEKSEIANTSVTNFTLITTVNTAQKEAVAASQEKKEDAFDRGIRAIREGRPITP
ncbi:type IV pilus assembly protein PilM [bacterium]|nr:type IV pilus assembly protein PilM [bacterium]